VVAQFVHLNTSLCKPIWLLNISNFYFNNFFLGAAMPCPTVHFSPLYFLDFLDFLWSQSTNPRRGCPVFPLYISLGIRLIVIGLNYLIFSSSGYALPITVVAHFSLVYFLWFFHYFGPGVQTQLIVKICSWSGDALPNITVVAKFFPLYISLRKPGWFL